MTAKGPLSEFMLHHYRHFNAAALVNAAKGYEAQVDQGNPMMITLAGAMSTAEIGLSLAEMIRRDKVQIIACTGANLEEDIYNLVAHDHYEHLPDYRDLTPAGEKILFESRLNRVTDTCIPEQEAFRRIERHVVGVWKRAEEKGERFFPHEFFYQILLSGELKSSYQIDPANSWLLAAAEKGLPLVVPGWEDSTSGNIFAGYCLRKELQFSTVRPGIEAMMFLADWYRDHAGEQGVGFFQIGGGIAGDFPICVVPMLHQDMGFDDIPTWSYFCQISDSTTSYGSYSGALPNEKITWGKINEYTPKFVIESDASIVAPLVFAYVLGW